MKGGGEKRTALQVVQWVMSKLLCAVLFLILQVYNFFLLYKIGASLFLLFFFFARYSQAAEENKQFYTVYMYILGFEAYLLKNHYFLFTDVTMTNGESQWDRCRGEA